MLRGNEVTIALLERDVRKCNASQPRSETIHGSRFTIRERGLRVKRRKTQGLNQKNLLRLGYSPMETQALR